MTRESIPRDLLYIKKKSVYYIHTVIHTHYTPPPVPPYTHYTHEMHIKNSTQKHRATPLQPPTHLRRGRHEVSYLPGRGKGEGVHVLGGRAVGEVCLDERGALSLGLGGGLWGCSFYLFIYLFFLFFGGEGRFKREVSKGGLEGIRIEKLENKDGEEEINGEKQRVKGTNEGAHRWIDIYVFSLQAAFFFLDAAA